MDCIFPCLCCYCFSVEKVVFYVQNFVLAFFLHSIFKSSDNCISMIVSYHALCIVLV